jgi:hypothetical protein
MMAAQNGLILQRLKILKVSAISQIGRRDERSMGGGRGWEAGTFGIRVRLDPHSPSTPVDRPRPPMVVVEEK